MKRNLKNVYPAQLVLVESSNTEISGLLCFCSKINLTRQNVVSIGIQLEYQVQSIARSNERFPKRFFELVGTN